MYGGVVLSNLQDVVTQYRPAVAGWEQMADTVNRWLIMSKPATVSTAVQTKRYLAQYAQWRLASGGDMSDPDEFLDVDAILFWLQETFGRGSASLGNARSALFQVGRAVTSGIQFPPVNDPVHRKRTRPPYSDVEVTAMWEQTAYQREEGARHTLTAVLALGLGAGLRTGEALRVRPEHVYEHLVDGIHEVVMVEVHERFPRSVPAVETYHEALIECAAYASARGWVSLVGPVDESRKDPLSVLMRSVLWPDGLPTLTMSRLRTTWMAHLLRGPVVVDEFMEIAGLDTFRSAQEVIDLMGRGDFPRVNAAVYAQAAPVSALVRPSLEGPHPAVAVR